MAASFIFAMYHSITVGVDAHIDPHNIRKSFLERRADVGIGPYNC